MGNKEISKRLLELAADDTKRSKIARLADVIDEVEAVLSAGVRRSHVIDELAAYGLRMTYHSFDSALCRIRKKRGMKSSITATQNHSNALNDPPKNPATKTLKPTTYKPVEESSAVEVEDGSDASGYGSHDPRAIDAIMRSTPDLEYYEKIARNNRRQKKS
jgi:hypothetical protein